MKAEAIGWVATAVGAPIVIVTLCWTLVICYCHRHYWRSTDLLIVAILSEGVIKQAATFVYTVLTLLQALDSNEAWCSGVVWLLTSIHILQAGTLATLICSRLLAVRSPLKYRQAVKRTHIVYHLVSLSILSSCIGVAAVLAEEKYDRGLQEVTNSTVSSYDGKMQHCTFLPHEMDRRYAILSITLHSLLDVTSVIALVVTMFSWCCLYRRQKSNISVSEPSTMMIGNSRNQKRQLLTSSSDLSAMSDISLTSTARNGSSMTQNGSNNGGSGNVEMLSGKCTTNDGHFMNGILANNLKYIDSSDGKLQAAMTYASPSPKTTSLDALPSVSCSSGFGSAVKSPSDGNCFLPNSNTTFHSVFPNSSSQFTNSSIDKSTDTLQSCAVISNYNHTTPKSVTAHGSNYDEMYERNYAATGRGIAEEGCRWTSESSYISTSTSSTNSRAPCLARQPVRDDGVMAAHEDLRLSSVVSILLLCYVSNHLPVLGLTVVGTFAPWLLPRVWSLPALVLWAGLAEECLLPILLSLCDRNFTAWVANIYTCRDRRVTDLARQHQGLDGKFRVFNTQSQHHPEIQGCNQLQSHQHQHVQQEPVKFPITNGSLFTSVDGRLPIIHNYRRGKGMRTSGAMPSHSISMGLPTAQARRNELLQTLINLNTAAIENQHSDLFKQQTNNSDEIMKLSQNFTEKTCEFQAYVPAGIEKKVSNQVTKNSRQQNGSGNMLTDFGIRNLNSEQPSSDCEVDLNSEDLNEYNVDDDDDEEPIYATLSSRSCCSATTAANDDFEFFQHEEKISKLVDNVIDDTEKSTMLQNAEKHFVCRSQPEEGNSGQSLLYRCQREILGNGDRAHQAYKCADWTSDQNSEVSKLVLPLIESYQNQNDDTELPHHSNATYNRRNPSYSQAATQNATAILKTVIQNELKNNKFNAIMMNAISGSTCSNTGNVSKKKESNSSSHQTQSEINNKDLQCSCEQGLETEYQKGTVSPGSSHVNMNLKVAHVTNVSGRKRIKKQNILAGSLSLNNLDELLLEEDDNFLVQSSNSRASPNERTRSGSQNDSNSSDEREVVFELPVKSESVLSLYRLELDGKSSCNRPTVIDICCKEANSRRFYKQSPGNRRILGQPTPLTRRLGQQTPPTRRINRQKKLPVPVLSVESLTTALNCAGVSYLDNGDLCRHGSVPDLKRVFVSDYI